MLLTNGDVDAVAGLLHLREGTPFALYAGQRVLKILAENPIFAVLDADVVQRWPMHVGEWQSVRTADGGEMGMEVRPFPVPGKVPLYLEEGMQNAAIDRGGRQYARPRDPLRRRALLLRGELRRAAFRRSPTSLPGAPLVFFDGTLFTDDEMIRQGVGAQDRPPHGPHEP